MSRSSPKLDSLTSDENAFITPIFTSVKTHGELTPYTPFKSGPLASSSNVQNLSSDSGVSISSSRHSSTSFSSSLLTRSMQGCVDDTHHALYAAMPSLSPLRLVPSQPSPLSVVPSPPISAPALSSSPFPASIAPLSSIPSTSSATSASSTARSTASTRRFMHFTFGANVTGADVVGSDGSCDNIMNTKTIAPNLPIAATADSDTTRLEDETAVCSTVKPGHAAAAPPTSAKPPHTIATSAGLVATYTASMSTSTSPTSIPATSSFSCSAPPFLDLPPLPSPTTRDVPSTSSTSSLSPSPPPSSLSQAPSSTSTPSSSSFPSSRISPLVDPIASNEASAAHQAQTPTKIAPPHCLPMNTTHAHQTPNSHHTTSMHPTPNTQGLTVSLSRPHLSPPARTQQSIKKPSKSRLLPFQTPVAVPNIATLTHTQPVYLNSSPTKPGKNAPVFSPKSVRRTSQMTPAASPPAFTLRKSSVLPTSPRNPRRKSSLFASPAVKSRKSGLYLSSPPTKTLKSTMLASSPRSIKRKSSAFASSPRSMLRKRSGVLLKARMGLSPRSLARKKSVIGNNGDLEEDNDDFIPEIRVTGGEKWEDTESYGYHNPASHLPNTYSSNNSSKSRALEGILSPRRAVRSRLSTLPISTGPHTPAVAYATTPYASTAPYAAAYTSITSYTPMAPYTSSDTYLSTNTSVPAPAYMSATAHYPAATGSSATTSTYAFTSAWTAEGRVNAGYHGKVEGGDDDNDGNRGRDDNRSGEKSGGDDADASGNSNGASDDKDLVYGDLLPDVPDIQQYPSMSTDVGGVVDTMTAKRWKADLAVTASPATVILAKTASASSSPTAASLPPSSASTITSTVTSPAGVSTTPVTSSSLTPPSAPLIQPFQLHPASISTHTPVTSTTHPLEHPPVLHSSNSLPSPPRSLAFTSPLSLQHSAGATISSPQPQHPSSSLILSPREHVSAALASPRLAHPASFTSPRQAHAVALASPRQRRSVALASPRRRRSVLLASPQTQQRRSLLLSSPLRKQSLSIASPIRKQSAAFFSPSAKHMAPALSPRCGPSLTPRGKHSLLPHTPHRQQSLAPHTPHRMSTVLPYTPHRTISAIAALSPRNKHMQNHVQNQGQSQKQSFFPQTPRRGLSLAPFSPRRKPSLAPYSPRRRPSVAPYSPRRTQRHSTLISGNFATGNSIPQKSGPGKYLSPRRFSQVPGKCVSPRRFFQIPAPTATVQDNISGLWRQLAPPLRARSSLEHYATAVAALRIHLADAIRASANEIAISSTHQYMSPHLVWALQQMAFIQDTEVLLRLVLQRVKTLAQLKSVYDRQLQRVAVHDVGTKLADDLCKLLSAPVLKLDREIMAKIPDSFEHVSAAIMEQGRINAEQAQHLSKAAFPTATPSSVTAAAFNPSTNTCPVHTAPHVPLKLGEDTILPVLHVDVVTEAFKQTFELDTEEEGRGTEQRNVFAEAFDVPERPKMPFAGVVRDTELEEEDEAEQVETEQEEDEDDDDEVDVDEEDEEYGEVEVEADVENSESTPTRSLPSSSAPISYPVTPTFPSHPHLHLDICSPASPASLYSSLPPTHMSVTSPDPHAHAPAQSREQVQGHVGSDVDIYTDMRTDTHSSGVLSPGIANLKKNPTRSTLKSPSSLVSPRTRVGKVEFHTPETKSGKSRKYGKYGFRTTDRVQDSSENDKADAREEEDDILTALPLSPPPRKHTQLPSTFSSPFSPSPFSPAVTDTAQSVHLHTPVHPFSPTSFPPSPSSTHSRRTQSGKSRALYLSPNPRLSIPRVQPPRKRLSLSQTQTHTSTKASVRTQIYSRGSAHTHAHSRTQLHTHSTAMHSSSTFSPITSPSTLPSQPHDSTSPYTVTQSPSLPASPPAPTTSPATTTLPTSPAILSASLASPTAAQTQQIQLMMRNRASVVMSPRGGAAVATPRSIWAHFKAKSVLFSSVGGETKGKSGNASGFPSPSLSGFERRTTVDSTNLPNAAICSGISGRGSVPFRNPVVSRESVLLTPTRKSPPLRKSRRFTKLSPNFPNPTLSSPQPPSTLTILPSFGSSSSSLPLSFADTEPHLYSVLLALPTPLSSLAQTCLSQAITAGAAVPVLDSECKKTVAVVTFNQLVAESSLSLSRAEHISCLSRLERTFCLPTEAPTRSSSTRRQLSPLMPVCVGPCWFGVDMRGQPTVKRAGVETPIRAILRPSTQLSSAFWERVPLDMVMGCELDAALVWGKVEMVEDQCLPLDLAATEEEACRNKTTEMGLAIVREEEEDGTAGQCEKTAVGNGNTGAVLGTGTSVARARQNTTVSSRSQKNGQEKEDGVKGRVKAKEGVVIPMVANDKLGSQSGKPLQSGRNMGKLSGKRYDDSRSMRAMRGVKSIIAQAGENGDVEDEGVYYSDEDDGEENMEEDDDAVVDEEKEDEEDTVFSHQYDEEEKSYDDDSTNELDEEAEALVSLPPVPPLPPSLHSHSRPRPLPTQLLDLEWEESDVVFPELRSRQPGTTAESLATHARPVDAGRVVPIARALKIQNLEEGCDWENSDLVIRKNKVGIPKKTSLEKVDGEIHNIQTISQKSIRPRPLAFTTLSENDQDVEISEITNKSGISHLSMPSSMQIQLMKAEEGLAVARRFVRGSINIYSDTVHEDVVELKPGKVSPFPRQNTRNIHALSVETISTLVDDDVAEIVPIPVHKQPLPRALALQMATGNEEDDGEVQVGRRQGSKHLFGHSNDTSNTIAAARRISLLEHAGEDEFLMQHVISHQYSGGDPGLHSRHVPGHLGMQIQCLAEEEDVCVELFSPSIHSHSHQSSTHTGDSRHKGNDKHESGSGDMQKSGKAGQLRVERLSVGYDRSEVPVNVITKGKPVYMSSLDSDDNDGDCGEGNVQYPDVKHVFGKGYPRYGTISHGVACTIEQVALDGSEVDAYVSMQYTPYDDAPRVTGVKEEVDVVMKSWDSDHYPEELVRKMGDMEVEVEGQCFEGDKTRDRNGMDVREKRSSVESRVKRGRDDEEGWRSVKRMSVCRRGSVDGGEGEGATDGADTNIDANAISAGNAATTTTASNANGNGISPAIDVKNSTDVGTTNTSSLSPSLSPEFTSPFASPFASPFTSPSRLHASTASTKPISYGVASGKFTSPSGAPHILSSPEKSKKPLVESPVIISPYQRMRHRLANQGDITDEDEDNSYSHAHLHDNISSEFEAEAPSVFSNGDKSDIGTYHRPYSSYPRDPNVWSTPPRSRHVHSNTRPTTTNSSNNRANTASTVSASVGAVRSHHVPGAPRPSRSSSAPSHYTLAHLPLFTTASARIRVDDALTRVPVPFLRADQAISAITLTRVLHAHARMSSALQQVKERLKGAVCGARSVVERMLQGQSSCTIIISSDVALYSDSLLHSESFVPSDLRFAATACISDASVLIHALPSDNTAVNRMLLHFCSCVMSCNGTVADEDSKRGCGELAGQSEHEVEKVGESSHQETVRGGSPVKILLHLARIIDVRGCSGSFSIVIRMNVEKKYHDASVLDSRSRSRDLSMLSLTLLFDSRDRYNSWLHGLTLLMATQGVSG